MERKALGKGISALIPTQQESNGKRIVNLSLSVIRPNPFQPRENFDTESMDELVQSIREKGIIQPILVRPKGEFYELIAGERRLRAANILQLKEIPSIVKDVEDRDSLEIALIENIQRKELNPIEEARACQYLIEKFNLTQEEVSGILGKARASITNILRLLKLPSEIQEEIKNGRISFAHGRALLEITDFNLQRRLVQDIIVNSLSVRELETMIKTSRPRLTASRSRVRIHSSDPFTKIMEEELQQVLATKVRIIRKKKRGSIVVEFYSQEDLERIAHKMRGEIKI
jgi:ParB family transcriptional regulator, chromosome partitioning protein